MISTFRKKEKPVTKDKNTVLKPKEKMVQEIILEQEKTDSYRKKRSKNLTKIKPPSLPQKKLSIP